MAKRYMPPGIEPGKKPEQLGSPALSAQKKLMSETGRREMARQDQPKRRTKKRAKTTSKRMAK